jgi:hypothetical protein
MRNIIRKGNDKEALRKEEGIISNEEGRMRNRRKGNEKDLMS